MSMTRWTIRKGRPGEISSGGWQVWECTHRPTPGVTNLQRIRGVWKSHADAVSWLNAELKAAALSIESGDYWS